MQSLSKRILEKTRQAGADAVVVSCPLCQSNLDMIQAGTERARLPVFYFTELLRLALSDDPKARSWFRKHVTDPVPVLRARGLMP